MLCDLRPERGWNTFESLKLCQMLELVKDTQSWILKKKMWTNQELYQKTIKVEPLKTTSPKNCNFMTYFDTNSHLATKPHKMTSNITEILKALSSIMESYRMICKPEACNQARISISKALQLIYSITKNHHTKIAGLSQIL